MGLASAIELGFALCGVWFVGVTTFHVARAAGPKITAWFTSSRATISALEARLAALEARIGIKV